MQADEGIRQEGVQVARRDAGVADPELGAQRKDGRAPMGGMDKIIQKMLAITDTANMEEEEDLD